MSNNSRVFNITRGFSLRMNQARKAIEQCACTWVEYGRTIRDCTLAEAIAARNEQAKMREPLENVEVPGLRYELPKSSAIPWSVRSELIRQADEFAFEAAQ